MRYGNNTIAGCEVNLRSYNGNLVGSTLRVKPGNTIKINFTNSLPVTEDSHLKNTPHGFNATNFHTHGLHVSPSGNSDNVLKEIEPQKSDTIEIHIPPNHPGGTHWYHPHKHGSTALQVSSGMEGAIIVEGALDEIPEIKKAKEKIFVFQQIPYDEQGKVEDFQNSFGPNKWDELQRWTTINGQIIPIIEMQPGEVQRWRFIHAGVRETIDLQLRKASNGELIKLHEIAVDGIPLGKLDSWDRPIELQPGYRSDVLVQADELTEEYLLVDAETKSENSLRRVTEPEKILARVVVRGESLGNIWPHNDQEDWKTNSSFVNALLAARKNNELLADITDEEIAGHEKINIQFNLTEEEPKQFLVNNAEFELEDPNPISLTLGTANEWTLSSQKFNHPFHIHVNPFQQTRKDPQGNDEIIWRDTLMVKQGQPLTIRSRYEDFDGKFVLHCHILDHEDQGMMKLVKISNQI
ncbi:Multicopper oxidase, types 2 and 3 [Nostoc sp. DSM 114161]|uniref:multicopper oxidase family protein n=1 Tax=Nostoc sp. DSM 114161 TaxID=3440143 RepID=UPI00404677E7